MEGVKNEEKGEHKEEVDTLTPKCKTRTLPSSFFSRSFNASGVRGHPSSILTQSDKHTQKTNYPVTLKFFFSAPLFRPDRVHLFCQALIWVRWVCIQTVFIWNLDDSGKGSQWFFFFWWEDTVHMSQKDCAQFTHWFFYEIQSYYEFFLFIAVENYSNERIWEKPTLIFIMQ